AFYETEEGNTFEEGWKNKLIWGDNKLVISSLLENFAGKINLIYIDPPFATGAEFKFRVQVGDENEQITKEHSILEEKAYRDTWGSGWDSYLRMMYERLCLMKELLADNGSIYVHLDWHVGHYVKAMMDEIFGMENFRNEIVWCYKTGGVSQGDFAVKHDVVLKYSKTDRVVHNHVPQKSYNRTLPEPHTRSGKELGVERDGMGKYRMVIRRDWWDDIGTLFRNDIERVDFLTQKPEALLKVIILASSNPGDLVADFFCGSGTTLAVAEKLGRRWIGCDLSRYAIHITRKRLLEIENSKDLSNEKAKKYDKKAQPFEILNLGKYERQIWQGVTFNNKDKKTLLYEYLAFILKLYGAEPISGFTYIHGRKGKALVHIGAVDTPVTIQEIISAMRECKTTGQKELHILGWEWEMGLNDAIQDIAKNEKIKLYLRIIPNDVMDSQAVEKGDVCFFELAYFKAAINGIEPQNDKPIVIDNRVVKVELKNFVIPHTDLIPDDVEEKITKWTDWIDYWAIDFNFQNDAFNIQWTSYRIKKNRKLVLQSIPYTYKKAGKYKIFVKIIDIFGIDTSQIFEAEVR
ncbi:MAG: DNA methyltransferase, partial [Candidatus Aerophobetes bacterium]|nr:DNA methyltransferase [Candidatus Aerophobetes bacterium]